ncbi:MAG: PKD domain-containing protein [Thermoplasmata archaeon]|nr:PKD domain-containing protein [Thermoplasmata archaeon]
MTIEGLQPNTTYYATVIVVDRGGLKSQNNPYVNVKTKRINLPPKLIKPIPDLQFHEDMGDGKALLNLTGYFWDDYYLGYNYTLYYEIDPPFNRQKNITAIVRTVGRYAVVDFGQKVKDWSGTESFRIIAADLGKDGVMSGDDLKVYSNWFNVTVLPTNDPPVILEVQDALGNVFNVRNKIWLNISGENGAQQGSEYMMTVLAEDVDGDPITFTADSEKVSVTPDPEHPTTMVHVAFTPTNDDVGFFVFNINASDPHGGYDLLTINISVKNINDPPYFTEVAGRSIPENRTIVLNGVEGATLWFIVKGDDPDLRFGDILDLTVSSSRFNISRLDSTTFNVSFTPTNEDSVAGSVSVDLVLMDKIRTMASNGPVHIIINVANAPDPPVLRSLKISAMEDYFPPRQTGTFNIGEPILFTVNITDPDGDPITVTWEFGDNTTASGFSVVHRYNKEGRYAINVTYTDGTFTLYRTDIVRITSDGDDDNDGLKDVWEIEFFGDLSHGPDEDPDRDGYNNSAEIGVKRETPFDPTDPNSPGTGTSNGGHNDQTGEKGKINMGLLIGVIGIVGVIAVIALMVFFIKKKMKQKELEEEEKLKSIELKTKEEIEEWRSIYGEEMKVGEILKPEERPVAEEEIDMGGGIMHEAGDEGSIHELPSEEEGPGWISAGEGPVFDESAPGPLFGESMELESVDVDEESGTADWSGVKEEEIEGEIKPEDLLPEGVSADEIEIDLEEEEESTAQAPPPPPPPPAPVKKEEEE